MEVTSVTSKGRVTISHITVEDRDAVERALSNREAGIDFADALHIRATSRGAAGHRLPLSCTSNVGSAQMHAFECNECIDCLMKE